MASKLESLTVLITGGAAGIGFAAAEEFGRQGCTLVLTDVDATALDKAAEKLRGNGVSVHTYVVDVSKKDQVDEMAGKVLATLGGLDVLVNNAGIGHHAELAATSLDTWRKLIDVNFWGPLYHVYAFLPSMMQRHRGHIVNVSSGQAFFRMPSWGAYAVTKLAMGAFSEILYFELRRHGIHVSTVYPFMTFTTFYDGVEATTLAARLSVKLLPYYGDTAQKVGRLIVGAVRRRKRVEMVNVMNDVGYYSHLIPPLSSAVSLVSGWLFAKDQ